MVPLQSGEFLVFRLFGLLFAAVAAAIALKPRELATRRVRTAGGDAARLEPTDAQVTLMRVVAAVFVLVGLGIALGGPFFLVGGLGPGF